MIWNSAGVFLVLSICGIVVASSERPVDCRKFVFAPLCRGVAAKRGNFDHLHGPPAIYVTSKSFRDFLKNFYPDIKPGQEEEDDDEADPLKNFYRKQKQEESIYKLFRESKRTNNAESDNVASPAGREYETI